MTLESYFRQSLSRGIIDHSIRASINHDNKVEFYIHPNGRDGDTPTYIITDNTLINRKDSLDGSP